MTIDQKVEAYRMRLEGATLQSIADHFEVSLEWIRQIVPPIEGKTWSLEAMRTAAPTQSWPSSSELPRHRYPAG